MRQTQKLLIFICLLYCNTAIAQNESFESEILGYSAPSSISTSYSLDNDQSQDWSLDLDIELFKKGRGIGGYRKSDTGLLAIQSYYFGLGTDPMKDISMSFDMGYWGHTNSLVIRHMNITTFVNAENWTIGINPQLQAIALNADPSLFNINLDRIELHSIGIGIDAQYLGIDSWNFSAGFSRNGFSRQISAISKNAAIRRLFSPSTLSLSSGLIEESMYIGADYYLPAISIGLQWQRTTSAIDKQFSQTLMTNASWNMTESFELAINLGIQRYSSTQILFINNTISYYW